MDKNANTTKGHKLTIFVKKNKKNLFTFADIILQWFQKIMFTLTKETWAKFCYYRQNGCCHFIRFVFGIFVLPNPTNKSINILQIGYTFCLFFLLLCVITNFSDCFKSFFNIFFNNFGKGQIKYLYSDFGIIL